MNDYPLLNLFWTMLWFFLFVAWIYLLIVIVTDVFRSDDMSGWSKALWVLFILFIPVIGVLVYLIARGDKMHARAAQDYRRRDEEMR
ncbi:MAG TPA: PLDc N-terminal domain-containing protein, partial [Jiangellaceae bacterium]|nr:PLDc N-terminal domain-containing protein [Jiangellaceae bacterium]